MLAKIWKKIVFAILIIACLYNIIVKLVVKVSFDNEIKSSAKYIQEENEKKEQ